MMELHYLKFKKIFVCGETTCILACAWSGSNELNTMHDWSTAWSRNANNDVFSLVAVIADSQSGQPGYWNISIKPEI
jgi:hypothetical protein